MSTGLLFSLRIYLLISRARSLQLRCREAVHQLGHVKSQLSQRVGELPLTAQLDT